jgi:hypothetical protein
MSRSYNKQGMIAGGNSHRTAHRVLRTKKRAALRSVLKNNNPNEIVFSNNLNEGSNPWCLPRDGMSYRVTKEIMKRACPQTRASFGAAAHDQKNGNVCCKGTGGRTWI